MLRKIGFVVGVLLVTASYGFAGNVQTFGIGSEAAAQAEAVAANASDPFAVYYNPAGLVLTERPVITTGFMGYIPSLEYKNFRAMSKDGQTDWNADKGFSDTAEISNSKKVLPHMGYAMPINDKLFFGAAAYSPYGLHINWDKDPAKNPGAVYAWESYYARMVFNTSLGYKLNDKLSFGFGVSLGRSESDAGKTFVRDKKTIAKAQVASGVFAQMSADDAQSAQAAVAMANDPNNGLTLQQRQAKMIEAALYSKTSQEYDKQSEDYAKAAALYTMLDGSTVTMETEDSFNYSFNAGVMYRPVDYLSFGLTYRGRTDADFKGDVAIRNATAVNPVTGQVVTDPSGNPVKVNFDGSVTMDYDHPESIQAGARYFVSKDLSVEFDMTWTRWSILKKQVQNAYVKELGTIVFDHDRNWEDTIQYKIGAEWKVLDSLALRGGYTYDPTPVPDHTFELGWPDSDRSIFNIGSGWDINESWVLDSSLQYIVSIPSRKVRGKSSELNKEYSYVYGEDVDVYLEGNGNIWGLGLTLSYLF